MATLVTYRLECRRLLHDATGKFWSDAELNDYINDARTRVCSDTGCLRRLVTAYLSEGLEQYAIGTVTGAAITAGGSNYSNPVVTFGGGGGSGAAATLEVTAGVITGITFTSYGSGYTSAPTATVSDAGVAGTISALTVTNPGAFYATQPTLSFSAGAGAGTIYLSPVLISVFAGGTGYAVGDLLQFAGGTSVIKSVVAVTAVSGGVITGAEIVQSGAYSVKPANPVLFTALTGVGINAGFSVFWGIGPAVLTNPGSGYTGAPTVTVVGGGGINGAVSATISTAGPGTGALITVGVIPAATLDIMNITPIWGNQRVPLNYMPFTEFNAKLRTWTINPQIPRVWSRYATSGAIAFVQPVPDQTYTTEFDTAVTPVELVDDADVDELSYPYTSPVAYYACWKAKIKQQAFAESESFLVDYKRKVMEAQVSVQMRRIPNPYAGYTGG